CKQTEPNRYRLIVADHFDLIIRSQEFNQHFNTINTDFEAIKQYIGVRLYPKAYVAELDASFTLGKEFAGDIFAMLVFDLPDSVTNIKPELLPHWNKSVDELFELGKRNIQENYPIEISKEAFEGFSIIFGSADHFFTPNIVLDLENQPELVGTYGSLIGLPHRHAALFYPIERMEIVVAINGLIPAIYGMHEEGPGSLSNHLFWYYKGTFTELPYQLEAGKLQFFPPEGFVDLLNQLTKN
ncbi:MAG: hypothetical protein AAF598_12135, partial [Bacteroidota bacterium]